MKPRPFCSVLSLSSRVPVGPAREFDTLDQERKKQVLAARTQVSLAFAAVTAGAAACFVLGSGLMDELPDTLVMSVSLFVAAAVAVAGSWRESTAALRDQRSHLARAAVGGAAAFWAAPLLALVQRSADAPSGTETVFFAVAAWGCIAALSGALVGPRRLTLLGPAAALLSLAGAAGLLSNWERPSSFSPFAKFPAEEAIMLAAGVLFVAGSYALAAAATRIGVRATLASALAAATVVGAVAAVPTMGPAVSSVADFVPQLVLLGAATYVFAWGWVNLGHFLEVDRAGAALLVVPVALTGLWVVERVTGAFGADPIVWPGATAGALVCVAAAAALVLTSAENTGPSSQAVTRSWLFRLAAASCLVGVASLALPALDARAQGFVGEPFDAAWVMVGAESAAGWVAAIAGLLALVTVVEARRGTRARAIISAALAVVTAALAYPFLLGSTLHTWNNWVPQDVQTAYGTEYARFAVDGRLDPVRTLSLLASAAVALVVLVMLVRFVGSRKNTRPEVDR